MPRHGWEGRQVQKADPFVVLCWETDANYIPPLRLSPRQFTIGIVYGHPSNVIVSAEAPNITQERQRILPSLTILVPPEWPVAPLLDVVDLVREHVLVVSLDFSNASGLGLRTGRWSGI
jgi:hypothetical protein